MGDCVSEVGTALTVTGRARDSDNMIILDLGATTDVIGSEHEEEVTDSRQVPEVRLGTANGETGVCRQATLETPQGLKMQDALVVPSSEYTLVSLGSKLQRGWQWLGSGDTVRLWDPRGQCHMFELAKGLFRYAGSEGCNECRAMLVTSHTLLSHKVGVSSH